VHAEVSNFPGTTIDISKGKLGSDDLSDTPGIYGVSSFNDEERIARKMIMEAEQVINVVSALSLDRDLFLTLQLLDMGKPMILVVNQWDEAQQRNMKIDLNALSDLLGIPVDKTIAVANEGINNVIALLPNAKEGISSNFVSEKIQGLLERGAQKDHAVLIAEGDEQSATECDLEVLNFRQEIYRDRRRRVNEIVTTVVKHTEARKQASVFVGRLLLSPLWGGLISAFVCYLIFYQLLGVFVAGTVVDFTEKKMMRVYCEPTVRRLVATACPSTITVDDKTFDFPSGT
jgi:ferrous iron transport protein B